MNRALLVLLLALILSAYSSADCVYGDYFHLTKLCICFQCFEGEKCEKPIRDCHLSVTNQQCKACKFWWKDQLNYSTVIPADFQIEYVENSTKPGMTPLLKESIRKLHELIGNAETKDRYMILGHGGTQLLHAFIYAFHKKANKKLKVYARAPFYTYYRTYSQLNPSWVKWADGREDLNPKNVVEFIAQPNNPDGLIKDPFYTTSPYVVHDLVYYWPHNNLCLEKKHHDNMLFSLSKMSGHSSSRLGWALVKDKEIAQYMNDYVWLHSHGVSVDAQFRSYSIIKSILDDGGKFFPFVKAKIVVRSQMLKKMLAQYGKGRIEIISPDAFVVVWLKCVGLGDCGKFFESIGVTINPGPTYGADENHARFNLQGEYTDFVILMQKLERYLRTH
eukprot:gene12315-5989_t